MNDWADIIGRVIGAVVATAITVLTGVGLNVVFYGKTEAPIWFLITIIFWLYMSELKYS